MKRIFMWTNSRIVKMDIYDGREKKDIKLDTSKFPPIPESNDFITRIKRIIDSKTKIFRRKYVDRD